MPRMLLLGNKLCVASLSKLRNPSTGRYLTSATRWSSTFTTNRFFAAATARDPVLDVTDVQTDIVKNAVKDLLEQRQTTKSITDKSNHLQLSYQNFKNLLNEARLSISDCNESQPDDAQFREETIQAAEAVDNVFAAYIDMLDDFRGCEEALTKRFGNVREESAAALRTLRQDLVAIQQRTD